MAKRKRNTGPDKRLDTGCPAAEWIGWHMFESMAVMTEQLDVMTTRTTNVDVCRNCGHIVTWQQDRNYGLPFYVDEDVEIVFLNPDE
jgi:hypothetical protein